MSEVFTKVLEKYEYVLKPIRFLLEKPLGFVLEKINFSLPEWWVHIVFLWLLVGAICDRALKKVDEHNPDVEPDNWIVSTLTTIGFSFLGLILLVDMTITWLKYEVLLGTRVYVDGEPVSGFVILAKEAFYVVASTLVFFLLNSFLA